ncbi:MAG: hypothetical protein A2293_10690 [Elusimicrobia bacterium RIFOXYB2_FULL_49_7]|nr:MAG: hypothetical protein A2293_10690 [Elusimicrobia bacterium RIFOXYB2_FULL_49_7]
MKTTLVPVETITEKIFEIRGPKVMVDADLAVLYGVPTKRLNEAVKRNIKRFPEDLMFQLTVKERYELVANCDRFTQWKHSITLPHAFTEAGVAMLSSILNSDKAIQVNLQIIRAFIRLRRMIGQHEVLRLAIEGLERRADKNERDIQLALTFLKEILFPSEKEIQKKPYKMGFIQHKKD